ncbi:MAG TPA: hypothetical protein PK513_08180 [Alphaproteobacteria bacterium]|nr:hypothetical protein [Alphaproteobacteria bacterium]
MNLNHRDTEAQSFYIVIASAAKQSSLDCRVGLAGLLAMTGEKE